MAHRRSSLSLEMSSAQNARGDYFLLTYHLFPPVSLVVSNANFSYCSWGCSKGSKSGASITCAGCQGSGMKISIRHLGPSMIQQMQHPCNECKGTGETISDKDRCPHCKGEKVIQEKKVLEVVVDKGMQNGQKKTFPGEADEAVMLISLFGIFAYLFSVLFLDNQQF